ncbi:MAG: DUF2079 domain-containing protein [Patescibacteria group bacterium]
MSLAYSVLSITRHNHFESGGFDLGIYDQGIWLYSHLETPYSTIKERLLLGDHFTITLPLLSPLFYIWDNVRSLLIAQAFFITFSSFAVYLIARIRKLSHSASFLFAVIYSLFYGIQYGVYFDAHPIVFAAAILMWLIYFYESKRIKLFFLSLVLFLLTQENTGIALAGVGIIYFFQKEHRRNAVLFILGGLLTSLAEVRIISYFSPSGYEYSPHFNLNPIDYLKRYFDAPDKILVWKYSLSSFSFLPLLSPPSILAMMLDLSQYFLPDKQYPHMITPFFHHRVILAPILALGSLQGILFLKKRGLNTAYLLLGAFIVVSFFQFKNHNPLNKLTKPIYYANYAWMDDNEKIIAKVPKNASVASQQSLVPHLSHRKYIYLIWPRKKSDLKLCSGQKECWWLDFGGKPEYLVIDTHEGATLTQLLESRENFVSALSNMQKAGKISLFKSQNAAQIYKINYR